MPNMPGVALAQTVAAAHPAVPVPIVPGYSDAVGLAAGLPRLERPFRQADLAAALAQVLSRTAAEPGAIIVDEPLSAG